MALFRLASASEVRGGSLQLRYLLIEPVSFHGARGGGNCTETAVCTYVHPCRSARGTMQSDCAPRRRHRVRERREHSMRTRCPPQAARTRAHTEGLPHSHSRACPPCMWRGTWGTWNLEVERVRRLRRRARAGVQCGRNCNLLSFVRSERFRAAVAALWTPGGTKHKQWKGGWMGS